MLIVLGCLRKIVGLFLLVVIVAAAYFYRDRLKRAWHDLNGGPGSESVAQYAPVDLQASANKKLQSIADGAPPDHVVLSSDELQAILSKRFSAILPGYVDSARVELRDGRVHLSARVPTKNLPQLSTLGQVASILPDTTAIGVSGQLIPISDGRVALGVDNISAAGIPLPHRIVPEIIQKIRRASPPGLPDDALDFPLPPGASTAYVRGDSLVLLTRGTRAAGAAAAPARKT